MKYLAFLDLASNSLVGEIPTMNNSLLSPLLSLYLSNNNLTGYFPALLTNYSNLHILDLGNNNIAGTIPPWIHESNLMLRILRLRSNMLSGNIPWQLSQLSHLHVLDQVTII